MEVSQLNFCSKFIILSDAYILINGFSECEFFFSLMCAIQCAAVKLLNGDFQKIKKVT